MTNKERAEELLSVLMDSEHHNVALALKEVLEKLRGQLSDQNPADWKDELNILYVLGYDDCLKDIDAIIDELEVL